MHEAGIPGARRGLGVITADTVHLRTAEGVLGCMTRGEIRGGVKNMSVMTDYSGEG
jgi:hypothetical protein